MVSTTLDLSKLPAHVGIIPDGNRRWAKKHKVSYIKAYEVGYNVLRRTLEDLFDLGVTYVSVYLMSRDNCLKRSRLELAILNALASKGFRELRVNPKLLEKRVMVKVLGDLSLVSNEARREAELTVKETYNTKPGGILYLALCYSGKWEVMESLKHGRLPESLSMPPIDLVIRTGGRRRLSDFFPLQASYAELYFTDTLWPDFNKQELLRALKWYSSQERLFGR